MAGSRKNVTASAKVSQGKSNEKSVEKGKKGKVADPEMELLKTVPKELLKFSELEEYMAQDGLTPEAAHRRKMRTLETAILAGYCRMKVTKLDTKKYILDHYVTRKREEKQVINIKTSFGVNGNLSFEHHRCLKIPLSVAEELDTNLASSIEHLKEEQWDDAPVFKLLDGHEGTVKICGGQHRVAAAQATANMFSDNDAKLVAEIEAIKTDSSHNLLTVPEDLDEKDGEEWQRLVTLLLRCREKHDRMHWWGVIVYDLGECFLHRAIE